MALLEIFDPKARPRPVGIDLGTTNSLVAFVKNERPVAIADCNRRGAPAERRRVLPSGERRRRRRRQARAAEHPRDTIVSVKRFMGRGADDAETRRLGPYEFVDARRGRGQRRPLPGRRGGARRHAGRGERGDPARARAARRGRAHAASAARSSPCLRTSTTRSGRPRRTRRASRGSRCCACSTSRRRRRSRTGSRRSRTGRSRSTTSAAGRST